MKKIIRIILGALLMTCGIGAAVLGVIFILEDKPAAIVAGFVFITCAVSLFFGGWAIKSGASVWDIFEIWHDST